jgi:uncharacterized membrane protein YfcA
MNGGKIDMATLASRLVKYSDLRKYVKSPWLEMIIMSLVLGLSFVALFLVSTGTETPLGGMSAMSIFAWILGFFLISFAIAVVSVLAGIGGGVIFTPIMLAFTPVDSLVIRATGLIVAMFSGLISTGPFLRTGLGNFRMCAFLNMAQGLGAFIGATGAIVVWKYLGATGEAAMRITLGLLVCGVGFYFLLGGQKIEWPKVNHVDRFTRWLKLDSYAYYEQSLNRVVSYKVTRMGIGFVLLLLVGAIGGFFGMGAGWAIVPLQNVVLSAPLKVAAANSGIILGIGSSVAVWPYILAGALIPIFAAPWLAGQVIGGLIGTMMLIKVRVSFIRYLLIGILFFTSFGLISKGLELLKIIAKVPGQVSLLIFLVAMVAVTYASVKSNRAQNRKVTTRVRTEKG